MLISIFALILFYYLSQFIYNRIKEIKTNNNKENQQNFWMFTYDFKKEKKESIFDRDTIEMIHLKNKKNKLIVLLYLTHAAIFIYINYFVVQILSFILK